MTFLCITLIFIFSFANAWADASTTPVNKAAKASSPAPEGRINDDGSPSLSETLSNKKKEAAPQNPRTKPLEPMRPNDPPNPETPHNTMPNGFPQ